MAVPKNLRPKAIDYGSALYKIVYTDKLMTDDGMHKLNGQINYQKCQIQLDPGVSDQSMIETILHESVHFFIKQYGHESSINSQRLEELVEAISGGLQLLLRLNPNLVKFFDSTIDA